MFKKRLPIRKKDTSATPDRAAVPVPAAKTSWGEVAQEYAESYTRDPDSYHAQVLLPNLLRLVAPKEGVRILEVGCGDGYFASAFAELGATVVGCDIAPEMIKKARAHDARVEWHVAAADALAFAEDASFDAVVIILAIQNIEQFQRAFAEAARVLISGGSLFIVMNHPAFRIPKRSFWGWDESIGAQFRRLDGYLSESREKIDMDPGRSVGKRFTVSFHRSLQVYVKALSKCGFAITNLEEWISHKASQPGSRAEAENKARKEFPLFLMLKVVKQPLNIESK